MTNTIAEVIHQNHFDHAYQKILIGLMLTNSRLEERQNFIFKQYDISLQQYNVLRILRGQYPNVSTLQTVKERMIDRMSDVSRIVERLRKSGLLTRVPKSVDRRAVDILISEEGLALLKKIDTETMHFYEPIKNLEQKDRIELSLLLDKLLAQILVLEQQSA
jgi:MarR family transcriptional regulator, multiple gene regulator MgrA